MLHAAPAQTSAVTASQLVGRTVEDTNGTALGVIDDLILSKDGGTVTYAAISVLPATASSKLSTGFAPALVVIPWADLQLDVQEDTVMLKAEKPVFEQAPHVSALPEPLADGWDTEIARYWWPLSQQR